MSTTKRIAVWLLAAVVCAAMPLVTRAASIDSLILNHEVSAANFSGVNARSLAMGQTGIATAADGSAMIYNPAGLARVRRLEVLGGFSHFRLENTTDTDPDSGYIARTHVGNRDVTKTHLDALSVVVPAPTYRGSLVFGLGLHRVKNFDRTFKCRLAESRDGDYDLDLQQIETESGGIYAWTGAAAVELSPRMAVGAGLHVYTGTAKYAAEYTTAENGVFRFIQGSDTVDVSGLLERDATVAVESNHVGVSASLGFSYQASPELTVGAVIETPSWWNIEEQSIDDTLEIFTGHTDHAHDYDWSFESSGYTEYALRHPFSFGLGGAFSHQQLNLALDVKYTDWSQMEYTDQFSQDLNAVIQESYREVVGVRLGAEYVFPEPGISLRVGYFTDPLPFPSDHIEKDRRYFTFGVGFLIDEVMTLDLAAVLGGYKVKYTEVPTSTEEYKTRRVLLTMAYRM